MLAPTQVTFHLKLHRMPWLQQVCMELQILTSRLYDLFELAIDWCMMKVVTMASVDDANDDGINGDVYDIFDVFFVTVLPQISETFQSVTLIVFVKFVWPDYCKCWSKLLLKLLATRCSQKSGEELLEQQITHHFVQYSILFSR